MKRRPLCLVWTVWMAVLVVLKLAGAPIFSEPVLTEEARQLIASDDSLSAAGRITTRRESRSSMQYILDNAALWDGDSLLTADDRPLTFPKILITTDKEHIYSIGSTIRCYGDVRKIDAPGNPGQFDARAYYGSEQIWYSMWSDHIKLQRSAGGIKETLSVAQNRLVSFLNRTLPREDAGIFADLVLGEKLLLDDGTRRDFQSAGIMHVLAISGLHISMIGMGLFTLLQYLRLPLPGAAAAASVIMLLYCTMIGSPGSAVRAMIMFLVMMGARVTKRSYDLTSALSLAGILMLASNPGCLFQAGYQLSFAAVIGAGVIFPMMKHLFRTGSPPPAEKRRARQLNRSAAGRLLLHAKRALPDAVLSCGSITCVTLPLVVYHYYELSLVGILGNLLIVPLMELVLVSGVTGCLAYFVSIFLARAVLFPGTILLELIRAALRLTRAIPHASVVTGKPELWQVVVYYAVLTAAILLLFLKRRNRSGQKHPTGLPGRRVIPVSPERTARVVFVSALLISCLILFHRTDPDFLFTVLDVGQGDCLFVRSRAGGTYLIDGGSSDVKEPGAFRIVPYLKQQRITRIDGVFLSHADGDHMNGILEILDAEIDGMTPIRIGALYVPEWMKDNASVRRRCAALRIPVRPCSAGMRVASGDLRFSVLHPFRSRGFREGNEGSMVLRLDHGGYKILLTGDLEGQGEDETLPYLGDVDVLKVAHHGSKSSTSDAFLRRTKPELCLVSAPAKSKYGHPHRAVLDRIRKHKAACLITRDCGAIMITEQNGRYRVQTFRKRTV